MRYADGYRCARLFALGDDLCLQLCPVPAALATVVRIHRDQLLVSWPGSLSPDSLRSRRFRRTPTADGRWRGVQLVELIVWHRGAAHQQQATVADDARSSPRLISFCSHWQSCTSLLRPGTYFICRASTNQTFSPCCSSTSNTGIQYTPVDSTATVSTPRPTSHAASAFKSSVIAPTSRTDSQPAPSARCRDTATQWLDAPMSMPAAFGNTSSSRLRIACHALPHHR